MISALSIISVNDGKTKKIADIGTFATTSIFSLWAYVWIYICLSVESENEITTAEAWITLAFFFILIIMSYATDKINAFLVQKKKTAQQKEEEHKQTEKNALKTKLRAMAREKGEEVVLQVAQG